MGKTAFVYHSDFALHETGDFHPETSARARTIYEHVRSTELGRALRYVDPEPAACEWIDAVHSEDYRRMTESACRDGARTLDGGDTCVCPQSYDVALLAAGSALAAVDQVYSGNCQHAFSCARPPGHHACTDRAMGFCLFNNIAIAARYAQVRYGAQRVLIVDWDVHHGNGSEEIFARDPTVLFFSTHQYPFYPGSGAASYTGDGPGDGFTINVPMISGADIEAYRRAFREQLLPAAREFAPDLVLISAGFDAHNEDPLASICLQDDDFRELTEIVKGVAEEFCEGRVVSVLEGGYSLQALVRSVHRHLSALVADLPG